MKQFVYLDVVQVLLRNGSTIESNEQTNKFTVEPSRIFNSVVLQTDELNYRATQQ